MALADRAQGKDEACGAGDLGWLGVLYHTGVEECCGLEGIFRAHESAAEKCPLLSDRRIRSHGRADQIMVAPKQHLLDIGVTSGEACENALQLAAAGLLIELRYSRDDPANP